MQVDLLPSLAVVGSRLAKASYQLHALQAEVQNYKEQLRLHQELLARMVPVEQLIQSQQQLAEWQRSIQRFESSLAWRVLRWCSGLRDRALPQGSRRRAVLARLARASKWVLRSLKARLHRPTESPPPSTLPHPAVLAMEAGGAVQAAHPLRAAGEEYAQWIAVNEPARGPLERQARTRFVRQPCFSVLVPCPSAAGAFFRAMLRSVVDQTYENWELCLLDDSGATKHKIESLALPGSVRSRIRVLAAPSDPDASARANAALTASSGEYVLTLDGGDLLAPFALARMVQALNEQPEADLLYSDEDCLSAADGLRAAPHFKPDWSPDTLCSWNYLGQLAVFSRSLLEQVGGFRRSLMGARHYDLLLRASEQARRIVHVPHVLYHQRLSGEEEQEQREHAEIARRALADHLQRIGLAGEVREGLRPQTFQVRYALPAQPLVSIIIPNKDNADLLDRCIGSIQRSSYSQFEVLIVENGSKQPATFACYQKLTEDSRVRVLTWERPFNYAALNNAAARQAAGEVLLFLNNDMMVINPDWLERMLEHVLRQGVGAVGAKLYFPDDTIQHAGMVVGRKHGNWHNLLFQPRSSAGYANRLVTVQDVTAVTGACLMMRRAVFDEVDGFDEEFVITYNDVDLCMKLRQQGYLVVWTPHAELYHFESVTRGYSEKPEDGVRDRREHERFHAKWANVLPAVDPYYSPHLTRRYPLDGSLHTARDQELPAAA